MVAGYAIWRNATLLRETFSIDAALNISFWIRLSPAGSEPIPLNLNCLTPFGVTPKSISEWRRPDLLESSPNWYCDLFGKLICRRETACSWKWLTFLVTTVMPWAIRAKVLSR